MSRVRVLSGLSAALALGLAACGDFTSSGDPLSESEATELAEMLVGEGFAGFGTFGAAPMGAPGSTGDAAVRITQTTQISHSGSCDGGGTVALAGTVAVDLDSETGVGTLEFNYTVAPNGCKVTTDGGKSFTITGDPNVKVTGDFSAAQTGFDGSLTYDGKFKWTEASRSGVCGVNLKVTYDFNKSSSGTSGSASMSGNVCGIQITRTISVEA